MTGLQQKLNGVSKLPDGLIFFPLVASSQGGFEDNWLILFEKLAARWRSFESTRTQADAAGYSARLLADASTALQRGQFRVISALSRNARRVDETGREPQEWEPVHVETVLPYVAFRVG